MPQYICKKCGASGYSKNIATRSFFPDNQLVAMLSLALSIDENSTACRIGEEQTGGEVIIKFFPDNYDKMNRRERVEALGFELVKWVENCARVTDDIFIEAFGCTKLDALKEWACEHEYKTQGEVTC